MTPRIPLSTRGIDGISRWNRTPPPEARHTPVMRKDELDLVIVPVEDSPDARLFIELSSYGADLTETLHALDLAISSAEQDSELAEARNFLVGYAVVSYCRAVTPSKIRKPLTGYVALPRELTTLHKTIKMFRNRAIAHSHSDLTATFPVGVVEAATLQVRDVMAGTMMNPLPWSMVHQFRSLVLMLLELLDGVIAPVRMRLITELERADLRTVVSTTPKVHATHKSTKAFNARSKRSGYPTSYTFYWDAGEASPP
jgi:hypothetical protein